jgi:hypothetical protein
MVVSYLRYLLCCSILLGGFERSGGVAGCFKCVSLTRKISLTAEDQLLWVMLSVLLILDFVCFFEGESVVY